jgi:hypothetical protein
MKTLLRISAIFSLLLMFSMAAFSQGGTVGMKFSPHTSPPPASTSPYQAYFIIYDVTSGSSAETSTAQVVSPTQENDYPFNATYLNPTHTFRFVAYVWDSSGVYSNYGSSATFTGAQYNLNPSAFKRNTDIIYL